MASIKTLKKDINYLSYELLTEAFTFKHFHAGLDEDRFDEIIRSIVKTRNELIARLNNPPVGEEAYKPSVYFSEIRKELVTLVSKLEELVKPA